MKSLNKIENQLLENFSKKMENILDEDELDI